MRYFHSTAFGDVAVGFVPPAPTYTGTKSLMSRADPGAFWARAPPPQNPHTIPPLGPSRSCKFKLSHRKSFVGPPLDVFRVKLGSVVRPFCRRGRVDPEAGEARSERTAARVGRRVGRGHPAAHVSCVCHVTRNQSAAHVSTVCHLMSLPPS